MNSDGFRLLAAFVVALLMVLALQACQSYRHCRRLGQAFNFCISTAVGR